MSKDRKRPNIREGVHNWQRSDLPFLKKVRVAAKNEWKKVRTLRHCCGNVDEPGC
jgi:hypothetical protein